MGKVLAVLMVVVMAVGLAFYLTGAMRQPANVQRLTLDAAGNTSVLDQFKGNVVVLDFWATWCGPCKAAMPGVQALHERYKGRPVVVIGANCMERADAKAYMDRKGYTYGLMTNADALARQYGVRAIPTFVVLDFEGNTLLRMEGADDEALDSAVESYLASKGV